LTRNLGASPRRFMRFDARLSDIRGGICDRSDAQLRNISLGGASFILENEIDSNTVCQVEIDDGRKKFHVCGKVAWVRKPGEMREAAESINGMYTIGVVFMNTYNHESGTLLSELINRLES